MSVRIRLRRQGAKKQPSYRIVVSDSRAARDGRFIEVIGHYNPRRDPIELVINHEKAQEWLTKGATTSEIVNTLFRREGLPFRPGRGAVLMARRQEEAEAAARREQRVAARQASRPASKRRAAPAAPAEEIEEAPVLEASAAPASAEAAVPVTAETASDVPASVAPEEEGGTGEATAPTAL